MSIPDTYKSVPSIFSSFTTDNPIGFGRLGERVAKTPIRVFPPSLGGRTVGFHFALLSSERETKPSENPQINQRCEYPSRPRNASVFLYSSVNSITPHSSGTTPLCLGSPNFVLKSVLMCAIIFNSVILRSCRCLTRISTCILHPLLPHCPCRP